MVERSLLLLDGIEFPSMNHISLMVCITVTIVLNHPLFVSYKKCENHDSPKQKIVLKISHLLKPGNRLLLQYVEYCRGSRVNQYVDLRKTDGKYNMMRDRSIVTKPKETIRFIGPFRSCGSLLTIKLGYIIRSKTSFHNKFVLEK